MPDSELTKRVESYIPLIARGEMKLADLSGNALKELARGTLLPERFFPELVKLKGWEVSETLVNNQNITTEKLVELAEDWSLCQEIAKGNRVLNTKQAIKILKGLRGEYRIDFLKKKNLPAEFLNVIGKESQDIRELEAIVGNENTDSELLDAIARRDNQRVNLAIAKAKKLSKTTMEYLVGSSFTKYGSELAGREDLPKELLEKFLKSNDEGTLLHLVTNPTLTEKQLLELAENSYWPVKVGVYINGRFSKENFEKLSLNKKILIRKAIFFNENLSESLRLKMAVEPRVYNLGGSYLSYWRGSRERLIPMELLHCGTRDMYNNIGQKEAGNLELAKEIRGYESEENTKFKYIHFFSPSVSKSSRKNLQEKVGQYNMDIFATDWWGWRPSGSQIWYGIYRPSSRGFGTRYYSKNQEFSTAQFELPHHSDGFVSFWKYANTQEVYLAGYSPIKGTEKYPIWWCEGTQNSGGLNFQIPQIEETYSGTKLLSKRKKNLVELVGTAIVSGGMFALWKKGEETVGWTMEMDASKIPLNKEILRTDLVPKHILYGRMKSLEEAVRSQIKAGIHL